MMDRALLMILLYLYFRTWLRVAWCWQCREDTPTRWEGVGGGAAAALGASLSKEGERIPPKHARHVTTCGIPYGTGERLDHPKEANVLFILMLL